MADRVGQRLDNYRLIRRLGAGSFGEVYLAEHVYRKTQVAVKVLPQLADDDLPGFLNEARTFRLKHPHIVQVLDFGVENRIPFIVMEYIPNGTLRQRYPKGTRLPVDTIVSYVKQIADALQYAHDEKLIHRDVKPANILLGSNDAVLLSDFGIATIARSSRSQSIQEMAGTITYMAPEQIQGKPTLASDQYALGVIVYEWLSGERPFDGAPLEIATQHMLAPPPSLCDKVPGIAPAIEQVVLTALQKDPNKRFASVRAFAHALEQACRPGPILPTAPPFIPSSPTAPSVSSLPKEPPLAVTPRSPERFNTPTLPPSLPVPVKPLSTSSSPPTEPPIQSKPRLSNDLLSSPDSITALLSVIQPSRQWRSRLLYPMLALLILLLVTLVSGGAYYFFRTGNNDNIDQNLRTAQVLITQASGEVASNPVAALHDLAQAQSILQGLQKGPLSDTQRRMVNNLLQNNLTPTVKAAISRYNELASITSLCATTPAQPINDGSTGTHAQGIASIQDSRGMLYRYALGQDNGLYEITSQNSLISRLPPTEHSQVLSLAGDRTLLFLLTSLTPQPAEGSPMTTYSLGLWLPGATREAAATPIGSSFIQSGQVPKWIAAWGGDVYVVLASPSAPNRAQILDYMVNANKFSGSPKQATISISTAIVSVAAFPGHQLFLLFADGSVQSLQFVGGDQSSTPVFIQHLIAAPLAVSDKDFTWTKPVPTVTPATQGGHTQLQVPGALALSAGIVETTMHLYILDAGNHRVIDLKMTGPAASSPVVSTPTSNAGGSASPGNTVTLQLLQQYVSSSVLTQVKSSAVDPRGTEVYVLTQTTPSVLSLVSINTGSPQSCA